MTPVRVGVVGLGLMGRVHSRNVGKARGNVVAGADVSAGPRAEFEDEFDVPAYEDHAALYAGEELDAVIIATPNRFHEAAVTAALEAGHDVFVEKPLAHSLDSAERIANAARESTGVCMVGFHSRFSPAATATRAYIDAGRFGDVCHIEARYVRRRGIPTPGSWFTTSAVSGGGALIDVGVHVIDLSLSLLGFPRVSEVTGVARSNFGACDDYADPDGFAGAWDDGDGDFDVEDSVSAFVRCVTGQTISLEVAWATNRPPANELVVRGTDAGARFDVEGEVVELYESGRLGTDHYVTSEIDARGGPDGHLGAVERFLEAVGSGEPPVVNTFEQALSVQRVIDGIYRSSETGRTCAIDRATHVSRADQ